MYPKVRVCVVLLVLLLTLTVGAASGQSPEGDFSPQDVSVQAVVNSSINYQGLLQEAGSPVTGNRDMLFRFHSNATCSVQVGADIVQNDVPVNEGLFSVNLNVPPATFNGQALWLRVVVNGNALGCREITAVPYALSVRPGAHINGSGTTLTASSTWESGVPSVGIHGINVNSLNGVGVLGEGADGVRGTTNYSKGVGVRGLSLNTDGTMPIHSGVYGGVSAAGGSGVYGRAVAADANYGLYSYGNIGKTGTMLTAVQTRLNGWVGLHSMESTEALFEDVGTGHLVAGKAYVAIDPVFAQVVNLEQPYQVFLTPLGDCGLYISEKTARGFTVAALGNQLCNVAFDYRILAKRNGFENQRLITVSSPSGD